jgi:hypothetical protein
MPRKAAWILFEYKTGAEKVNQTFRNNAAAR